jgi:hypothetical protein
MVKKQNVRPMNNPAKPPYIGFFNPISIDTKNMTRKTSLISFTPSLEGRNAEANVTPHVPYTAS